MLSRWWMCWIFSCRDGAVLQRMATRPATITAGRTSCLGEAYRFSFLLHVKIADMNPVIQVYCVHLLCSSVRNTFSGPRKMPLFKKKKIIKSVQEIASLKRQFAELLSDIGFIKEGLRARIIERTSSKGTDGVLEATGREVTQKQV